MKSPRNHKNGLVAILDAMGAAAYGASEIERFMASRDIVLQLAHEKAEEMLDVDRLNVFTFNDTIVFALAAGGTTVSIGEASAFFQLLRKFMIDSLQNKILFRGAISIGTFYSDKDTNTIMGEAVTDAASWYAQADWVGIYATPRTTILLSGLLEDEKKKKEWVMVDYPVPMKDSSIRALKVVNWPKALFVPELVPSDVRHAPRALVLSWFGSQPVPRGAESKCFNAVAFFDYIVENHQLKPKDRKPKRSSSRS